jgi:hypothetical protein
MPDVFLMNMHDAAVRTRPEMDDERCARMPELERREMMPELERREMMSELENAGMKVLVIVSVPLDDDPLGDLAGWLFILRE